MFGDEGGGLARRGGGEGGGGELGGEGRRGEEGGGRSGEEGGVGRSGEEKGEGGNRQRARPKMPSQDRHAILVILCIFRPRYHSPGLNSTFDFHGEDRNTITRGGRLSDYNAGTTYEVPIEGRG